MTDNDALINLWLDLRTDLEFHEAPSSIVTKNRIEDFEKSLREYAVATEATNAAPQGSNAPLPAGCPPHTGAPGSREDSVAAAPPVLPEDAELCEQLRFQTRYVSGLVRVTMDNAAARIEALARDNAKLKRLQEATQRDFKTALENTDVERHRAEAALREATKSQSARTDYPSDKNDPNTR